MAKWRQAVEVAMTDAEIGSLTVLSRSRTEPARRVERAQMLLACRENPSFFAVGQRLGVHHQTVQRCVERAVAYGPLAALDDARDRQEPTKPGWCHRRRRSPPACSVCSIWRQPFQDLDLAIDTQNRQKR
jgi:hypothetical protein